MYCLLKIDEWELPSYPYLAGNDECFYFMDYFSVKRGRTTENDLILDFKMSMDKREKRAWKHKWDAIDRIRELFVQSLPQFAGPDTILVPVPPSKMKSDPLYDDRVVRALNIFCKNCPHSDLREIISINANMVPSHEQRASPDEILPYLTVDPSLCLDQKPVIVLVDDVLTTGAHFKACQTLLKKEFPDSTIKGLFIARAVH
jgi:predicted amidophosphoribosyltransferase